MRRRVRGEPFDAAPSAVAPVALRVDSSWTHGVRPPARAHPARRRRGSRLSPSASRRNSPNSRSPERRGVCDGVIGTGRTIATTEPSAPASWSWSRCRPCAMSRSSRRSRNVALLRPSVPSIQNHQPWCRNAANASLGGPADRRTRIWSVLGPPCGSGEASPDSRCSAGTSIEAAAICMRSKADLGSNSMASPSSAPTPNTTGTVSNARSSRGGSRPSRSCNRAMS